MDVAAEITATEFSEVIRTHFGLLYLFFFYAVAAALTSICARQNKNLSRNQDFDLLKQRHE